MANREQVTIGPGRRERQGQTVHTVALARRRRAVREDVAELAAAAAALDFGAVHAERGIVRCEDSIGQRLPEPGPAIAESNLVADE